MTNTPPQEHTTTPTKPQQPLSQYDFLRMACAVLEVPHGAIMPYRWQSRLARMFECDRSIVCKYASGQKQCSKRHAQILAQCMPNPHAQGTTPHDTTPHDTTPHDTTPHDTTPHDTAKESQL